MSARPEFDPYAQIYNDGRAPNRQGDGSYSRTLVEKHSKILYRFYSTQKHLGLRNVRIHMHDYGVPYSVQ